MEKYYFTFGSWEKFPYQNTYLVVVASSYGDAVRGFREKHPDVNPDCMNCSDCYSEKQWERVGKHYADQSPAEVIWTETCFGKKPEGYGDLLKEPEIICFRKTRTRDMLTTSTMSSTNSARICRRLTEGR